MFQSFLTFVRVVGEKGNDDGMYIHLFSPFLREDEVFASLQEKVLLFWE